MCGNCVSVWKRRRGTHIEVQRLSVLVSLQFHTSCWHLHTESKTFSFYVYEEIARRSPTPQLPSSVDIQAGLRSLGNRSWENNFSFYEALHQLTSSLNDGHSIYLSNCYNVAQATSAFPVVSVETDSGGLVVNIAEGIRRKPADVPHSSLREALCTYNMDMHVMHISTHCNVNLENSVYIILHPFCSHWSCADGDWGHSRQKSYRSRRSIDFIHWRHPSIRLHQDFFGDRDWSLQIHQRPA